MVAMETARKTIREKEKFVTFQKTQAVKIWNIVPLLVVFIPGLHVNDQARKLAIVRSDVSSNKERVKCLVRGLGKSI